jgi:hypothetical protein
MRKPTIVHRGDAGAGLSDAALFGILWDALVDLLGTAATAALVRRAAGRALARSRELSELTIARVDGDYSYTVPHSLGQASGPPVALRGLADALRPLLAELTGDVALRHLEQVPELRALVPVSARPS